MDKQLGSLSSFRFLDYKVVRLSYIFNPGENIANDFSFKFGVEVEPDLENYSAKVTISVTLEKVNTDDVLPFELDIAISGLFEFDVNRENITPERFTELCKKNGTVALFPFLRSAICDITKACNVQPLILPLINFINLFNEENNHSLSSNQ